MRHECLIGVQAKVKAAVTAVEDKKKAKEEARKAKANAIRQVQLSRQRKEKQVRTKHRMGGWVGRRR